jgi:hypothetical protein
MKFQRNTLPPYSGIIQVHPGRCLNTIQRRKARKDRSDGKMRKKA